MNTCRRERDSYYTREHLADCQTYGCAGCKPCTHDEQGNPTQHCTARNFCTEHLDRAHPLTCPRCIGRTRSDLAAIENLHVLMLPEAIAQGLESEAANLAGPAADPEAWSWHKVSAREQGREMWEDDDPRHPISVLGAWDFMLREDYDLPTGLAITVARAVDFLDGILTRLAQDSEQDWPMFSAEVAACRAHMESVLHDSRRPEQGAACPECKRENRHPRPLVRKYADHDKSGASDRWVCPVEPSHEWTEAGYRLRVAGEYVAHATELPVALLAERIGVPTGTIRRWAAKQRVAVQGQAAYEEPPLLKPVGRSEDGRKLYSVEQAEALRDERRVA